MSETLRSGSAKYPIRSVRFKYLRNFYPSRPYLQPNRYKDDKAVVQAMRRLHAEQELTPEQARIMAETRPREELYDLQSDPHELYTGSGAALQARAGRGKSSEQVTVTPWPGCWEI